MMPAVKISAYVIYNRRTINAGLD